MWTYDQLIQFAAQIVGNFQAHQWLIGVAVLFGGLTAIWRGDVNLPAPIGPWIRAEQTKRFSASFQYITIALVCVTAIVSTMASGIPLKQAVLAAITAALTGLFGHDAIKATVKAGLKATPPTILVLIVAVCCTAQSGCWLSNMCGESGLQVMHDVGVQLGEARAIVDSQEQAIAQMQTIPADKQAEIQAAFAKAHTAIAAAEASDQVAQQACSGAGLVAILGGVAGVLSILEPLVLPLLAAANKPSRAPMLMRLAPQAKAAK